MAKRNSLPSWYPAACHTENIHWSVPQWIEALSHRSQLVRAEAAGELELEQLEAVIRGSATPTPYPTVIQQDYGKLFNKPLNRRQPALGIRGQAGDQQQRWTTAMLFIIQRYPLMIQKRHAVPS